MERDQNKTTDKSESQSTVALKHGNNKKTIAQNGAGTRFDNHTRLQNPTTDKAPPKHDSKTINKVTCRTKGSLETKTGKLTIKPTAGTPNVTFEDKI